MAKTALETLLGKEGFEKYHVSRKALKEQVLTYLKEPGTEFNWQKIKASVNLFMGDQNFVKHNYAAFYHYLTGQFVKGGKLTYTLDDRGSKIFTVLKVEAEESQQDTGFDYATIFPVLKKLFWQQVATYREDDVVTVSDVLDALDLPAKQRAQARVKYRNYVNGRLKTLAEEGVFSTDRSKTPYTRGRTFVRTAKVLTAPEMFEKYSKSRKTEE